MKQWAGEAGGTPGLYPVCLRGLKVDRTVFGTAPNHTHTHTQTHADTYAHTPLAYTPYSPMSD